MLKKVNFNGRVAELDFFKGFAVIMMIFNHLIYDIGHIFFDEFENTSLGRVAELCAMAHGDQTFILLNFLLCAEIFIIVSGIVGCFAKNTFKEGVVLAVLSVLITAVTLVTSRIIGSNISIWFGVFHFLAFCMLISPLLKKLPLAALAALAALILVAGLYFGSITVRSRSLMFLSLFNFRCAGFVSSDFYPIFPHLAFYIAGIILGRLIYKTPTTKLKFTEAKAFKPLRFLGAYSFEVYVVHQPVLIAILFIITRFF